MKQKWLRIPPVDEEQTAKKNQVTGHLIQKYSNMIINILQLPFFFNCTVSLINNELF